MPRQPRILLPSGTLHVVSRGNRRQDIFEGPPDYARFVKCILEQTLAEGIIVLGYCLMPNHYHLIVQAAAAMLSRAMHRILSSQAAYMNKKYGRTGHLFGDRFHAFLCDPELGLKPLLRYVHRNPIRGGLVSRIEDWPWSSHRDYMNPASDALTGKAAVLEAFGQSGEDALSAYTAYMQPDPEWIRVKSGGRCSLAALASLVERELGHFPGFLKVRSNRRDLTGARRKFINLAFGCGHSGKEIAEFLCIAKESVFRLHSNQEAPAGV